VTEADLLAAVLYLAKLWGWRSLHIRAGRTAQSWRTSVQGDGVGFPDLLLVRGDRVIVAELKSSTGRTTTAQSEWLIACGGAGIENYIWRPQHWNDGRIAAVLAA
jgi:hypothetical protein